MWRAYKGGLVLTVTRLAANGWQAVAEGKGVTERSPALATRLAAQRWADSRARSPLKKAASPGVFAGFVFDDLG